MQEMFLTLCLVDHISVVSLSLAFNLVPLENLFFSLPNDSWLACCRCGPKENLPNSPPRWRRDVYLLVLTLLFGVVGGDWLINTWLPTPADCIEYNVWRRRGEQWCWLFKNSVSTEGNFTDVTYRNEILQPVAESEQHRHVG